MKKYFLLTVLIIITTKVFAGDITFEAQVNQPQVELGSSTKLSLTITGTQDAKPIQLPKIEGFNIQYRGPSTQMTILNGVVNQSKTFNYAVFPLRTGKFTIPALTITIDGVEYASNPIEIEVKEKGEVQDNSSQVSYLKDKAFAVMQVSKDEVFLHEPVELKVLLYIGKIDVDDIRYPQIDQNGFTMDELSYKKYIQNVNSQRFKVYEFDGTLYPTRSGELIINPATIDANVLTKSGDSRDPFFSDSFFQSFFNSYEKMPITLETNTSKINVKELPKDEQPDSFIGGVGNFSFDVTLSPTSLKVGDPITIKIVASGRGNVSSIDFPSLDKVEGFKFYEPKIKIEGKLKSFEQVAIPVVDTIEEFPAIEFSYFDVDLGKYKIIKKGPFKLDVSKSEGSNMISGVSTPILKTKIDENLGEDVVFIKDSIGSLKQKGINLHQSLMFWIVLFVYAGAYILVFNYVIHHSKIKLDKNFAKRVRAPKIAKKFMKQAVEYLESNNQDFFYQTIHKTIADYLSHKINIPIGAIDGASVYQLMLDKSIRKDVSREVARFLKSCEEVRFAKKKMSHEDMHAAFLETENLLYSLEGIL